MLFAVSDTVWLAFIGVLTLAVKEYFDWRRSQEANRQRVALSDKVEVIHAATNGMKDQLVAEVKKASFAAGEKSEADKAK